MGPPTGRDRVLALVSAGQLATEVCWHGGEAAATPPYDVLWMHGTEDGIGRDVLFKRTALSAPVSMLIGRVNSSAGCVVGPLC
jgi:hypothetical protein